jgi:hypothetical protein
MCTGREPAVRDRASSEVGGLENSKNLLSGPDVHPIDHIALACRRKLEDDLNGKFW